VLDERGFHRDVGHDGWREQARCHAGRGPGRGRNDPASGKRAATEEKSATG
jgi:hypothetical protein